MPAHTRKPLRPKRTKLTSPRLKISEKEKRRRREKALRDKIKFGR